MKSPFVFDVAALLRGSGLPENIQQSGPSPARIGPEMIAIPEGGHVDIDAHLIPLGGGISVQATIQAQLKGQCSRCLRELSPQTTLNVSEVFAVDDDFITGEAVENEDELPQVNQDSIDLLRRDLDDNIELFLACKEIHDKLGARCAMQPVLQMSEMARVSIRNAKWKILPKATVHHAHCTR